MKKYRSLFLFTIVASLILFAATIVLLFFSAARQQNDRYITIDPDTIELVQLEAPKEGDPIAVVDTTLGEIRFVLYPDRSPNAVRNFTELAESGYYDNTYVYDIAEGVCAMAGAKQQNGEYPDGYDESRERVKRELDQDLWPFRGAIVSVNTYKESTLKNKLMGGGDFYNGSRFAFVDTIEMDDEIRQQLLDASESSELGQAFIDLGGVPNLSQQMTVIGQTYEGFDVIDALTSLESENNGRYSVPKETVMINSVTITTYSPEE